MKALRFTPKRRHVFPILAFLIFTLLHPLEIGAANMADSVRGLLERVVPAHANEFIVESIPSEQGKDVFEIESKDSKIVLRGNTGVAAAVALNWYLKYYCHCSVSLNGRQLNLTNPLPPVSTKLRMTGWAQSRYLLNYCTFSYSMSWWDWAQWEQFIDWMALNGINMPLAVTGQEAVWQAVCRKLGMTEQEIDAFLPGAPYLPFCWMGCLDGHGGPLPKDWIPLHVELEKRILMRERELGMKPVLQGFTGHIPSAIAKKHPGTKTQNIRWIEFDTCMLDPQEPLFQRIANLFMEEQTRLFGTDHLYAADSFIEMTPPSGDLNYLTAIGRAILDGMAKTDPHAVWLLQGWTFMNQSTFWQQDRIRAFLDSIPNEHILVLDLFCESHPVWSETQGFYGKPWIWCFVYNFGNQTILGGSGPMARFNDLAGVRKNPLGRNCRGVGLMMEGFGHNPPIFDLMFELAWREEIPLQPWMREFYLFRYGKSNADAEAAWDLLRKASYEAKAEGQTIVTAFPAIGRDYRRQPGAALAKAWQLLSRAQAELGGAETYRHDLVNVARESLDDHACRLYAKTMAAFEAKDKSAFRLASGNFLQLIRDLDELLATSDDFLLGKWIEDARRWGATEEERARLEWNARRILTLWGTGASLRDYAWKEWSGLLNGFYAKRWEIFFARLLESMDNAKSFDQNACNAALQIFETGWASQADRYPAKAHGDSIAVSKRLYEKYCSSTQPSTP
jgi:alpha-N-acetylglucosaminidase